MTEDTLSQVDPMTNGHVSEVIDTHEEERHVKLRGESGNVEDYAIREMTSSDQAWWMKQVGRRIQVSRSGKPIKQDYEGMHADLIHLCLYGPDGKKVNKAVIQSWGPKCLNRLFALCQEVNGLNDKVSEVEGND
jgi:hypothetical protein